MENIRFQNTYEFNVEYLPTKRSRKHRKQTLEATAEFKVQNLLTIEAPVVFKIHDFNDEYARALGRSLSDDLNVVYPVRYYKGKFYREYICQNIDKNAFSFIEGIDNISRAMENLSRPFMNIDVSEQYYFPDISFDPEKSLSFSGLENKNDRKGEIQRQINQRFIVVKNRLYVETSSFGAGEPRYAIYTLGLGHNHGGTSLSINFSYNGNLSNDCYFRADEYERAVTTAVNTALTRGDTDYAEYIKENYQTRKSSYIEILDQSVVQLHPSDDAGKGDPFLNELESVISSSPDKLTAGLGVIAKTVEHRD